jgi:recombination protein RecR
LISPLDGVNPEDINLKKLIERIDEGKIKEVILALKPSIEGETTMQYIRRILENKNVKITKIATGIPIGTDMEYIDAMTLEMSLEERKEIT